VIAVMPLGYPKRKVVGKKRRKPFDEVVSGSVSAARCADGDHAWLELLRSLQLFEPRAGMWANLGMRITQADEALAVVEANFSLEAHGRAGQIHRGAVAAIADGATACAAGPSQPKARSPPRLSCCSTSSAPRPGRALARGAVLHRAAPRLLRRDRAAAWRCGGGGARHDRARPTGVIDIEAIRQEFPITRRGIYLDNATLGPPPTRHVRAVTEFLQRMSSDGLDDLFAISDEGVDDVRAKAAAFLHADLSHVFFVRSTSHGVAVVAEGLTWREGDEVVLYELDHPAGVFPWLNLADRGVKVSFIKDRGRFGFDADDVREMLSPARGPCASAWSISPMGPARMWRRSPRSAVRAASGSWWTRCRPSAP